MCDENRIEASAPEKLSVRIGPRRLGPEDPPLVVAELSANHMGDLDRARRLIDAAAACGAEAVKLQTYTPDTMTIDVDAPGFRLEEGLWAGRTLYDLYREAYTPYEWHAPLFEHARGLGLIAFSTPFDETAVELLESLEAPAYKIASFEILDLPLVRRAARSGKPLVISTGMASEAEIAAAVGAAREGGSAGVVLLHCVSAYPARPQDAHLRAMPGLAARHACLPGLSDHTQGEAVAVAAVALGARLIEKHFTLSRAEGGADAAFSLEPEEMGRLVRACREAHEALGSGDLVRGPTEAANRRYRRSLYVVRDVPEGAVVTAEDVRSIRPGFGLEPSRLAEVVGRRAARALRRGEPVAVEMVRP